MFKKSISMDQLNVEGEPGNAKAVWAASVSPVCAHTMAAKTELCLLKKNEQMLA